MPDTDVISNPIRGRFNAWFFGLINDYTNRLLESRKKRIFANLPKEVVEIGPGIGANFTFFAPRTSVIALEPNVHMHKGLNNAAARHDIQLTLLTCKAEEIGLDDNSVDSVVCTLVLCTVCDPQAVLSEVKRILKPGGHFYCIEHVHGKEGTFTRRLQGWLFKPWKFVFEGCEINRDTGLLIEQAGFSDVNIESYYLRSPFFPVNTQIMVSACK